MNDETKNDADNDDADADNDNDNGSDNTNMRQIQTDDVKAPDLVTDNNDAYSFGIYSLVKILLLIL